MKKWRLSLLVTGLVVVVCGTASAQDTPATPSPNAATDAQDPPQRPVAIEYSDGYELRAKIHKYASFATLPLFATELALGQSLYNTTGRSSGGTRTAHQVVGTSIGVLFGVNTVTGVWNLWEARKDPNGRTRRIVHGLLMLSGDAGFLATTASAPSHGRNGLVTFDTDKNTHRTIAITSIGLASAGYLVMLFGGH
jgi:hypothetical protein